MIDIICYYDNHHDGLFNDLFFPTYKKHLSSTFNLVSHRTESKYNESLFESQNWCEIMINRFDILKQYIVANHSKWAIFRDIDIIFFDNFITDIMPFFYQEDIDIAYMSECINNRNKWYVNGGFFLFKCSDYIYNYFDHIQNNVKQMSKPNDQTFIHQYLKDNVKFKNSVLNQNIFLANNQDMNYSAELIKKRIVKVFHATSTMSFLAKTQVLSTALCIDSFADPSRKEKESRLWI